MSKEHGVSLDEDGSLEEFDLFHDDDFVDSSQPDSGRTNWGLIIGALVTMAAIIFIVFDGLQAETYFYTVDEAVTKGDKLIGNTVRVKGVVEDGTLIGSPGELKNRFRVAENGEAMSVVYFKALPDTFQEGSEVVIQGKVDANFQLIADEVLVKCPSRYEGQPPGENDVAGPQAAR